MDLDVASDQKLEKGPSIAFPFPSEPSARMIYGLYVTILPIVAFWGIGVVKPEWQSGKFSDYLALFLSPEASLVFLFLLAYSVICYLLLLIAPTRYSQLFPIRFGIYTGVLLALQYSIVAALFLIKDSSVTFINLFLLWIFPVVYSLVYCWATARWTIRSVDRVVVALAVVCLVIATLVFKAQILFVALMAITVTAPFWSLLLSLRAAIWLFKNYETGFTLPRGLGLTAWLATYVVAWRFDILKMYELYAALPKEPPDCYIATAAAQGHPQFVRAQTVRHADGRFMQVNAQLQWLKCAELALLAVNPRLHKPLRQFYDVVGKYLAQRMQSPFLADIAYLLLKPCEWSARSLLKIIVPEIDSISKKMYR